MVFKEEIIPLAMLLVLLGNMASCSFIVGSKPEPSDLDSWDNDDIDMNETETDNEPPSDDSVREEYEMAGDSSDMGDIEEDESFCRPLLGGECNLVDNCGCDDESQSCQLHVDMFLCEANEKCQDKGLQGIGDDCDPEGSECGLYTTCYPERLTNQYKCHQWCNDISDCGIGVSCGIIPEVEMGSCGTLTLTHYKLCNLPCPSDLECDPYSGNGCAPPSGACLYYEYCGILICATPGIYHAGELCSGWNSCVIGAQCLSFDDGATFRCYEYCDDMHACGGERTCQPFVPPYISNPSFGICI